MDKQNIDWSKLGFEYTKTDYRFSALWEDGQWNDGELLTSEIMQLHEGSPALHYAHASAALEVGAHVLCEKPFTLVPHHARAWLSCAAV